MRRAWLFLRRVLDPLVALALILVLAPVLIVLWILVRTRLGAPVLFRQERPGLHGRPFTILKFRTMTDARGPDGTPLPDDERMTPFGRLLRRSSLDELPELFNVLRGEMAFVGPRPLLMEYLPRYTERQRRRHEVPPGVTGWAQVNGRNTLDWATKFELDVWYVDHVSPWLDLKILLMTVGEVIRPRGISHDGHETMPLFEGDDDTNVEINDDDREDAT